MKFAYSPFHPVMLIGTWFGAGLSYFAPGTFGTLLALPFAWLLIWIGGHLFLLFFTIFLFFIGWWISNLIIKTTTDKDPQYIVIDEVVGVWLALSLVPLSITWFGLAFLLFRAADIWKFWPASWIDRHWRGGFGIMADDIIAGIYAGMGTLLTILGAGFV